MSLTYGFFNSLNNDRLYDAEDFSEMFDGVINDGVFASIGEHFAVSAVSGLQISVASGRAWLGGRWIYNDTGYPITLDSAELILNRIDTVCIKSDSTQAVRACSITVVKGTPGSSPVAPTLTNTDKVKFLPLANVYIAAGVTQVTGSNITNRVGTSSCPFVTAILQTTNIDALFQQWGANWDEWFSAKQSEATREMDAYESAFETWFETVQDKMDPDVGTRLTADVTALEYQNELTIPVSSWTTSSNSNFSFQARVNDPNIKATSKPIIGPGDPNSFTEAGFEERDSAYALIKDHETFGGYIIFYAYTKPTAQVKVRIKGV